MLERLCYSQRKIFKVKTFDRLTCKLNEIIYFIIWKHDSGITKAYPFVAASCVSGFPSGLNESVRSLRTDHPIAVYPEANCKGSVKVAFRAGSHPDLLSYIKNQAPEFQTVMKSFFMFKYKQNNIQLFCKLKFVGQFM